MGDTAYVPDTTIYPDNTFVDEIKSAANPSDNGIISEGGNKYFDENTYPTIAVDANAEGVVPKLAGAFGGPTFVPIDTLGLLPHLPTARQDDC